MTEKKRDLELVTEPTAPEYSLAVMTREDGRYGVGQAVTTNPGAPWYKGDEPKFADDRDLMAAWRALGSPLFVAQSRFDSWKRDGYFSEQKKAKEVVAPPSTGSAAIKARPDVEKEVEDVG